MFEWREVGIHAMHLRRRLTLEEQASVGLTVCDIRGTPEADERLAAGGEVAA